MHVLSALVAVVAAACSSLAATNGTVVPPGQRQLFLDDRDIAKLENLRRTMHQPTKRGAVVEPDQPWETVLQTRCAPAWDEQEKVFKLWLITSTPTEGVGGMTYVQSPDGIHWTKPILRQWEYQGSRENNFVALEPQSQWPANAIENVVYDPDDADPNRRYKGFLGAFERQAIVSPDGIHWKRLAVPALPSQDESNLSYDRCDRTFIATLKTSGSHGRSHAVWTSKDFQSWTDLKSLFHADAEDQRLAKTNIGARLADPKLQQPLYSNTADYNADIYNIGIFRYEGLYLGLPAVYHSTGKIPEGNTDGFHLIQLAASRDLHAWQRLGDRQAFIGPSPPGKGAYDLTQLLPPSAAVVRDDELWFYYTGLKYRASPKNRDPRAGAICLAVLRRDGFISLDAGETPGTLLTKPLTVRGTNLFVNVDAAGGTLDVTVLEGDGKPLAVSEPIVGDHTHVRVPWKSGNLANLKGKIVNLRFVLRKAKVYSFWFGE